MYFKNAWNTHLLHYSFQGGRNIEYHNIDLNINGDKKKEYHVGSYIRNNQMGTIMRLNERDLIKLNNQNYNDDNIVVDRYSEFSLTLKRLA